MRKSANVGHHTEPFTGTELRKCLEQKYGAVFLRQDSTSHVQMQLPNGRIVKCAADGQPVTKALMRWNARVLGETYPRLRNQVGAPIVEKRKPRYRAPRRKVIGRNDVLHALNQVIDEAERLKGQIYRGDRDAEVYRRLHEAASGAHAELTGFHADDQTIRQQANGMGA